VAEGNNSYEKALERAFEGLALERITLTGSGSRRDATVRVGGRDTELALRWAGRGWPHEVEAAIQDIESPWPAGLVVVASQFSSGAVSLLRERDANWADLVGQARIVIPDRVAIVREPPRSANPPREPPLLWWSPSAISTAEAVLTPDASLRTKDLADLTGWSMSQISKTLRAFDRHGWTRQTGPERGPTALREVVDAGSLLSEWSRQLIAEKRPQRFAHTTRRDTMTLVSDELAPALAHSDWMLSGWAGAALLAPLSTTVPTVQAYLARDPFHGLSEVLAGTQLHAVDEGGRIEFWPADEHTLRLARRERGLPVASPPRVYADLKRLGERGADAADHLRSWWMTA
jgi:hypothetical protein